MTTKRKVAANRANSQKSTGPQTEEGKRISSQNARTHGLYAENFLLEDESKESYEQFHAQFLEDQQPRTAAELILIEQVLTSYFLSRRAMSALQHCSHGREVGPNDITRYYADSMKVKNSADRTVQRVLEQLAQIKRENSRQQPEPTARPLLSDPAITRKWQPLPNGGFVSYFPGDPLDDTRQPPRGTEIAA